MSDDDVDEGEVSEDDVVLSGPARRREWRAEAVESAHYARLRAAGRARRARLERRQPRDADLDEDAWTVAEDETVRRVPTAPEDLGSVIQRIVGDRRWDERLRGTTLFDVWPEVVGADLAQHARPVRLAGGILVVEVTSPGWATQVTYLADDLVTRCNAALDQDLVTRIDVRVR